MKQASLVFVLLLGSSSFAACVEPEGDDRDGDDPVVEQPPAPLATDGAYRLESTLSLESAALLPAPAYEAVQTLEGLRDHPADTLFDLAEEAGVPAVGTLRDALPSSLESRINGWIDEEIRGITTGDGSLPLVIDGVLQLAHAEVGRVHLTSQLTLAGGSATHRLDTVELEVMGHALAYDVAPLAGVGFELDVPVAASISRDGGGATVALGAHAFGLPYGKLAWRVAEDLTRARYGRDLRTLLADQLRCPAIAAAVAGKCVLGVCVGHASDLRAICEAGLDRAVDQLQARVEALTVAPIALDAGTATFADENGDHLASSISGTWTARLDLGIGPRPAPSTFTGIRQ